MEHELTATKAAQALNITQRSVRRRADREGWLPATEKTKGGYKHTYVSSSVPNVSMAEIIKGLPADTDNTKKTEKEEQLELYGKLPGIRKTEAEARLEILWSRDAFIRGIDFPLKKGSDLFCEKIMSGSIGLADWITNVITRKTGIALSTRTLSRWQKARDKYGIAGLAPKYNNSGRSSGISGVMKEFIIAMKVDYPHIGIPKLIAGLSARFAGEEIPGRTAIRRFWRKWEKENKSLLEYITNPDKWKSNRQFAAGSMSENITRLNQLWEMDSTPTDVMLAGGRYNITGVIDVYSRRLKLLVSPTAKATAIAALIRKSLIDWGVPEVIRTDNGKDYVAQHIDRVLDGLEVWRDLCAPFTPEQKPFIERALGTFSHDIVELLPGYIGHNVANRKDIEARRSFSQRLMKQGADPIEIKMTAEEFQSLCDRWVNAIYHYNQHSGLDGKTPVETARAWKTPVRKVKNERALDILLAQAPKGNGMRIIGKKGIKVQGGYYIAPEMAGYEGESVQVLLDAADFGGIYLYRKNGQYLCRAIDPGRAGISRKDLAQSVTQAQKQVMREGKKELKKLARETKTKTIHTEILAHREEQIANILDFKGKEKEYNTPALSEAIKAVESIEQREFGPQPIEITPEEEKRANEVIEMSKRRCLPANDWEKYEMLNEDLIAGKDLTDTDLAWMKKYELWLETGKDVVSQF